MSARLDPSVGQIRMDDQRLNVLATMNGSSECLTVNFETISKSLAGIKSFFSCLTSCFTGQSFKDQINLNTIADTLDDVFTARNISDFRQDIRGLNSKEKTDAKNKILNIARNLTLIADRKGRTNPNDPGALRLRAIVSRLGQEFDVEENGKSSSDLVNGYVLLDQGSGRNSRSSSPNGYELLPQLDGSESDLSLNDEHSSSDSRGPLSSQNDENSVDPFSSNSPSDNGSVNFSEEGSSLGSSSSETVTSQPSPSSQPGSPNPSQGSPVPTNIQRRRLAKQNEQRNLEQVREEIFADLEKREAEKKAAARAEKRAAVLKKRLAKTKFDWALGIELKNFLSNLERYDTDPDGMMRALVFKQEGHKKRCEKFISDHVEPFEGATREKICIDLMQALEEAIQQKQLLAEVTGAVGVSTQTIPGRVALVQAAHLQLLKDYVKTLGNFQ